MKIQSTKDKYNAVLKELLCNCGNDRKDIFESFTKSHIVNGFSPTTINNHLQSLIFWDKAITQDFTEIQKTDVDDALMFLESYTFTGKDGKTRSYSQASKNMRKIHLKMLLNFIGREDLGRNIKIRRTKGTKLPEDLLTRDEVHKMIEAAQNLRDKAIISLLYESGARSGEILSLHIKNIERHEKGYYVHFPEGKTGARKILVVYSAKHIFNWLQSHPLKNDRNAALWVDFSRGSPLQYSAFHSLLYTIGKRVGIGKKVNPHSFRHAQATELAKDFTEQQMKRYLGWTPDSDMASVYVHLSGRDIDDAILKKNGIKIEDRDTSLQHNECPKCHFLSEGNLQYCGVCGTPLTADAITKSEMKKQEGTTNMLKGEIQQFIMREIEKMRL